MPEEILKRGIGGIEMLVRLMKPEDLKKQYRTDGVEKTAMTPRIHERTDDKKWNRRAVSNLEMKRYDQSITS
jgi:hypothetical protein